MKQLYIATFYSHFGAMRFKKTCTTLGMQAKQMPVPRSLSSSCGTCVRFETDDWKKISFREDEVEQIVEVLDGGYHCLYRAADSW